MKKLKSSHYFHRQEFKHLAVDIYMTDAKTIKVSICWIFNIKSLFLILSVQVEKWFGKKKQITYCNDRTKKTSPRGSHTTQNRAEPDFF